VSSVKFCATIPVWKKELSSHPVVKNAPINNWDALYGGRTEAAKMWYKARQSEEIHYVDVISLYPSICRYLKLPVGHPHVHVEQDCASNCLELEGTIKCRVLPPRKLYHPLPSNSNTKLMFTLCATCATTMQQGACKRSMEESMLTGTWVVDEVRRAIERGVSFRQGL
jgi:hypothetical protein